jgi:hypothetical protein
VSLKHLCALHFENGIQPGQTVKLKPGKVWFTLEVLVDDEKNRYSMAQSAAVIAIVSIAAVATVASAGAATVAAGGTMAVGSAIAAKAAPVVALGETAIAGFAGAVAAGSTFLQSHAGTAAKLSAVFLPKAIEAVEKEVGGFTAVQKEVVQILSSPNVSEDVRTKGFSILGGLMNAWQEDQAKEREAAKKSSESTPGPSTSKSAGSSKPAAGQLPAPPSPPRPVYKRAQSSVSTFISKLNKETRKAAKGEKREAKMEKKVASWEVVDFDAKSEPTMLSTKEQLRIWGLRMNERRHFEIREKAGKLVLIDANTKQVVAGGS